MYSEDVMNGDDLIDDNLIICYNYNQNLRVVPNIVHYAMNHSTNLVNCINLYEESNALFKVFLFGWHEILINVALCYLVSLTL
jgi:hypothetical protein